MIHDLITWFLVAWGAYILAAAAAFLAVMMLYWWFG
jgi:hypothetical protein